MKKLVLLSLGFLVAISLSSCTSGDANNEDANVAASTDENPAAENAGDFGSDSAAVSDAGKSDDANANAGLDDAPLNGEQASGDKKADSNDLDLGDPETSKSDKQAEAQPAPSDDQIFANKEQNPDQPAVAQNDTPPPTEPQTVDNLPPPTSEPEVAAADSGAKIDESTMQAPEAAPAAPVAAAPYEKIKAEPFEKNGVIMNRVYLTRKGDTAKSVSMKIYGTADHAKDLKAWNSALKKATPTVGTKVYYNSPKDPQDNSRMMVFYEEMGVEPQKYMTQAGDDIRKVSAKLLGHKDSWKEIYATNAGLENKSGQVQEGIELRYWPSTSEVKQTMAQQMPTELPPATNGGLPQDPMVNTANLPPDDPTLAANQMPPPQAGAGTVQQPPAQMAQQPPPMPEPQMPVPPPVAEPKPKKQPASPPQSMDASNDSENMIMVAGALAVIAAAAAFIVIRRQRAKRIDLSQQTQV